MDSVHSKWLPAFLPEKERKKGFVIQLPLLRRPPDKQIFIDNIS
jgi:hypothetical protein